MFYHFLYNNGADISSKLENLLISKLKASSLFKKKIKSFLKGVYAGKRVVKNKSVQFDEDDLYFSIQKMGYSFSAVRTKGNWRSSVWKVNITAWDTFDFTEIRLIKKLKINISIGNAANDLGYWLQKFEIGKEFVWVVNYNVTIKV